MIYVSDEAGADAIYLRPFPNADDGKWRVSGAGTGVSPRWRADGKEILYVDGAGSILSVAVTFTAQAPAPPQPLFRTAGLGRAGCAVSHDGARFLMPVPLEPGRGEAPLSVVLKLADALCAQVMVMPALLYSAQKCRYDGCLL